MEFRKHLVTILKSSLVVVQWSTSRNYTTIPLVWRTKPEHRYVHARTIGTLWK